MAQILLAASSEPQIIAGRILAGHQVVPVNTVDQAGSYFTGPPMDMVLCTVSFDESQMFGLLRLMKETPGWAGVPFVGARVRPNLIYPRLASEALEFTCLALGGAAFLDIIQFREDPEREMREAIERLLGGRKPAGDGFLGEGAA
jgi:hypothetical protein